MVAGRLLVVVGGVIGVVVVVVGDERKPCHMVFGLVVCLVTGVKQTNKQTNNRIPLHSVPANSRMPKFCRNKRHQNEKK